MLESRARGFRPILAWSFGLRLWGFWGLSSIGLRYTVLGFGLRVEGYTLTLLAVFIGITPILGPIHTNHEKSQDYRVKGSELTQCMPAS